MSSAPLSVLRLLSGLSLHGGVICPAALLYAEDTPPVVISISFTMFTLSPEMIPESSEKEVWY